MEKDTIKNIILASITAVLGILVLFSPWMVWTSYKVANPEGMLKSFSLIPSDLADSAWLFYDLLPILSWLPVFGGLLIIAGVGLFFLEISSYKTFILIGFILCLIIFILFIGFISLFLIADLFGLDLSYIGIPVTIKADFTQPPSMNGIGGWVFIISLITLMITSSKLKITQYEEYLEEFKGLKEEEIKVHEKKIIKGTRKCPKCSNSVPGEQLFCDQCGHYF